MARCRLVRRHAIHGEQLTHGVRDEHQPAVPLALERNQRFGGADPRCHVHVVTAAMHGLRNGARIGQTGFLFERKRVELRTDHHRRARPVLE